jgi:hypothetical protein
MFGNLFLAIVFTYGHRGHPLHQKSRSGLLPEGQYRRELEICEYKYWAKIEKLGPVSFPIFPRFEGAPEAARSL